MKKAIPVAAISLLLATVAHADNQAPSAIDWTAWGRQAGSENAAFLSSRGLPANFVNCQIRAAFVLTSKVKTVTPQQRTQFFDAHERTCVADGPVAAAQRH